MNFSVSEFSSNLARQKIFPAWIQELVKAISNDEPVPNSYVIGENIQTEVWRNELKDDTFRTPSGHPLNPRREALGERYGISFVPTELGFYTLGSGQNLISFGVNPSPDESDLRQVDKQVLPDTLKEGQQGRFVAGQEDYESLAFGRPVFHLCIFAALALLILELGFQLLVKRLAT
jgi:hypothetical protein